MEIGLLFLLQLLFTNLIFSGFTSVSSPPHRNWIPIIILITFHVTLSMIATR